MGSTVADEIGFVKCSGRASHDLGAVSGPGPHRSPQQAAGLAWGQESRGTQAGQEV